MDNQKIGLQTNSNLQTTPTTTRQLGTKALNAKTRKTTIKKLPLNSLGYPIKQQQGQKILGTKIVLPTTFKPRSLLQINSLHYCSSNFRINQKRKETKNKCPKYGTLFSLRGNHQQIDIQELPFSFVFTTNQRKGYVELIEIVEHVETKVRSLIVWNEYYKIRLNGQIIRSQQKIVLKDGDNIEMVPPSGQGYSFLFLSELLMKQVRDSYEKNLSKKNSLAFKPSFGKPKNSICEKYLRNLRLKRNYCHKLLKKLIFDKPNIQTILREKQETKENKRFNFEENIDQNQNIPKLLIHQLEQQKQAEVINKKKQLLETKQKRKRKRNPKLKTKQKLKIKQKPNTKIKKEITLKHLVDEHLVSNNLINLLKNYLKNFLKMNKLKKEIPIDYRKILFKGYNESTFIQEKLIKTIANHYQIPYYIFNFFHLLPFLQFYNNSPLTNPKTEKNNSCNNNDNKNKNKNNSNNDKTDNKKNISNQFKVGDYVMFLGPNFQKMNKNEKIETLNERYNYNKQKKIRIKKIKKLITII